MPENFNPEHGYGYHTWGAQCIYARRPNNVFPRTCPIHSGFKRASQLYHGTQYQLNGLVPRRAITEYEAGEWVQIQDGHKFRTDETGTVDWKCAKPKVTTKQLDTLRR